jgi:hypothetical protein
MAFRPTRHLIEGELDNTQPGIVTGWIQFAGMAGKVVLHLQGNFHRDIQGTRIRFTGNAKHDDPEAVAYVRSFSLVQNGKVGDITAGLPPFDYIRRPYIEWYSEENGRVVIEPEPEQVEVIGQPLPLDRAVRVSREEQAANLNEYVSTMLQTIARQGGSSSSGRSNLPPPAGIIVMMDDAPEED